FDGLDVIHAATMPRGAKPRTVQCRKAAWSGRVIMGTSASGSSESPILALDQVGKPAIFDALSRAYVGDSRFPFIFFCHDHHARVRSRSERNHEGVCTGPPFDSIDEPGMICHDAREMVLDVIVDFNKQRVFSVFAPCE